VCCPDPASASTERSLAHICAWGNTRALKVVRTIAGLAGAEAILDAVLFIQPNRLEALLKAAHENVSFHIIAGCLDIWFISHWGLDQQAFAVLGQRW
jgi:hypothetical protein